MLLSIPHVVGLGLEYGIIMLVGELASFAANQYKPLADFGLSGWTCEFEYSSGFV